MSGLEQQQRISKSLEQGLISVSSGEKGGKGEVRFRHNPETLITAGTGEVLMLGLKEDSLTITFYTGGLKRQFKYHLLK